MTTRTLLHRIAHVLKWLSAKMHALQEECDRLSAMFISGQADQSEWDVVYARSEVLQERYVRLRDYYHRTAIRIATGN